MIGFFAAESLWAAFEAAALAYANHPAVSIGDVEWTYCRLFDEADAFRRRLNREGNQVVLFVPRNTPDSLAFLLGATGSTSVPLLADPAWKTAELEAIAHRCGASMAACDSVTAQLLPSVARAEEQGGIGIFKLANPSEPVPRRHDTSFGRFTSGTTGFSRCLQFCDQAALAAAEGWCGAANVCSDDRVLCLATLNNGLAFNTSIFSVLLSGGMLAFHPGMLVRGSLAKTMVMVEPTVFVAFPFAYELLASAKSDVWIPSTVRLAVSSAAPLSAGVRSKWEGDTGLRICDYYGLAEVGPCTFNDGSVPGSMGVPLRGVDFAVFNENGRVAATGETGRIRVKTRSMASAYLDSDPPDFASNLDERNYYVTKDTGLLTMDGRLELRGRVGQVVNIAGRKIDPAEVEAVIRRITGVREVVVRREEDPTRPFLAAYIESSTVQRDDVVQFCSEHMAQYKIPQLITILPQFPRSAAGKISLGMIAARERIAK
jgi:long-chain acyl-CoA synthetase